MNCYPGKRISLHEKAAYHEDVDIYFQPKAWVDTKTACDWVTKTLKPGVQAAKDGDKEFILLCDNLVAQTSDQFKRAVRKINGLVWFGPPGTTDIWQPVDASYGRLFKRLITREQEEWLEHDENWDRWVGYTTKPLTATDRRVLITQWVGEANKKMQDSNYDGFRRNCFERTGCLITADGSEDFKIRPEGLSNYQVPPPLNVPGNEEIMEEAHVEPADEPDDVEEVETEEDPEDDNLPTQEERHDSEGDRVYTENLVGRKIRGLYESGWHVGVLDYFNVRLKEYHIRFPDSDEDDYIKSSDIDGVEMVLV